MLYHVTFATWGREPLFTDDAARRAFLRALLGSVRAIVLFCLVDDHLHLVLWTDAPASVAGVVLRMLRQRCPVRVDAPRVTPVGGRPHLERLVAYLANQPEKHGIRARPALYPGGCLVDLLGARRGTGFDPEQLWRHLPRRSDAWLLELVGSRPPTSLDPRSCAPARVWEAALAAHLATPTGRERRTVEARAVTVRLCSHLSSEALSALVPIAAPTIRSLRSRFSLDPSAIAATTRWLALADEP